MNYLFVILVAIGISMNTPICKLCNLIWTKVNAHVKRQPIRKGKLIVHINVSIRSIMEDEKLAKESLDIHVYLKYLACDM